MFQFVHKKRRPASLRVFSNPNAEAFLYILNLFICIIISGCKGTAIFRHVQYLKLTIFIHHRAPTYKLKLNIVLNGAPDIVGGQVMFDNL